MSFFIFSIICSFVISKTSCLIYLQSLILVIILHMRFYIFSNLFIRSIARYEVSKPEELPLKLLSEPCLTVSHHTAPSYLAVGVAPNFQCANIFEFSFAILSNHFVALFLEFLFLYFLLTHLIKHLFMYLSILYIAVL